MIDPEDTITLNELHDVHGYGFTLVETDEEADDFVRGMLDGATDQQRDMVRAAYYRPGPRRRVAAVRSAARSLGMQLGGADIGERLVVLLELVDSIHDFHPPVVLDEDGVDKNEGKRVDLDAIVTAIAKERDPKQDADDVDVGFTIPRGLDQEKLRDIPLFCNFIRDSESLTFADGTFDNPLHGVDILSCFDAGAALAAHGGDITLAYEDHERYVKEQIDDDGYIMRQDLWFTDSPDHREPAPWASANAKKRMRKNPVPKKIVFMAQVASLCANIAEWYGHGELTFIVDSSDDHMSRMIFATTKVDAAILREFAPVGPDHRSHAKWNYSVCDANVIDGPSHFLDDEHRSKHHDAFPDPRLSVAATGPVFRETAPVQVILGGITKGSKGANTRALVSVVYGDYEDMDVVVPQADNPFSTKAMRTEMNRKIRTGDRDVLLELAQKRACDWGQVQHCRVSGGTYIYVTGDRLAALYSVYRDVNVISIKHSPPVMGVLQTSFIMSRSDGAEAMEGGGHRGRDHGLQVVLAIAIVAGALWNATS